MILTAWPSGGDAISEQDDPFWTAAEETQMPISLHLILVTSRPRVSNVQIAGPQRAPFNEIVARYLKAVGDPRQVVKDPDALYFGGPVEEFSLVPLGEARLGRIDLDEWLRRSHAKA